MQFDIGRFWFNRKPQVKKAAISIFAFVVCCASGQTYAQEQRVIVVPSGGSYQLIPFLYTPPPAAPTAVSASQSSDNNATISWPAVSGADSYKLEWFNSDTGQWEIVYSGSANSFTLSNLSYGSHKFRVKACSEGRCGDVSATRTVAITLLGDTGSNSVGAVQGSGGVSGGSAFYSIPIVVPPGRKGVQPSVSLSYSSRAGNGVAGVGWSVSGGSSIHRCSATFAQDGFTASVQYNASRDRLCLNGQRLMNVSGTYGASGTEYRTELDQFARVKQTGSINSASSSFTVEFKDGIIGYFGTTSSTRQQDAGRSQIMTWAMARSSDRSGNSIHYDYSNHSEGEHLLNAIHYTGTNNTVGDRHVRFIYQARPDPTSRFLAGGKSRQTKRLTQVKTEYGGTKVRTYTLNYGGISASSERSLVRSIQECAFQGSAEHCLPGTTFNWQEKAPQFSLERLQFKNSNGSSSVVHADKRWIDDVMPRGDHNGDGVRDWPGFYVNAEGEKTGTHSNMISNCYRRANSFTTNCLEADFDSDGRTDSFQRGAEGSFNVKHANSSTWITTNIVWPASGKSYPIGFSDFNGDGWIDVAFIEANGIDNGKLIIYKHSKIKNTPYLTAGRIEVASIPLAATTSGPGQYTKEYQIHGDVDGNGYADFIEFDTSPASIRPAGLPYPVKIKRLSVSSNGAISFNDLIFSGYLNTASINANYFHDVNGDGLTDWLAMANSAGRIHYKLNNGNGFAASWTDLGLTLPTRIGTYETNIPGEPEVYVYPIMSKVLSMDYNGDGKQDLLIAGAVQASSCHGLQEASGSGPSGGDGSGSGGGTPPGEPTPPPGGQPLQVANATTTSIVWRCDEALYGTYQERQRSQHQAQINSAILDDSARNYQAIKFVENANGTISVAAQNTNITASASQAAVLDATGDGLPDIITVFGCRFSENCEWNTQTASRSGAVQNSGLVAGAYLNRNRGASNGTRYEAHDMMKSATTGLGVEEQWVYRPLSSDEYDTGNSDFYQTTHSYQENDFDYFHFASSMYVVAEQKSSNGIGGLNSTKYRYRGAIYNNKGRGFQGFRTIIQESDAYGADPQNLDTITRTDYQQKWPLSGISTQSCRWLANDNKTEAQTENCSGVLSKSVTNSVQNVATAGGARFVSPKNSTQTRYKLAGRSLLGTTTNTRSFDSAGNVILSTQVYEDAYTKVTTQTTDTYNLNYSTWWLNKLDRRVVLNNPLQKRHSTSPTIAAGTDGIKQTTTDYNSYDATHRLPNSISISANDSSLNSTITTQYTSKGLPRVVSTTGTSVTGPRTITTTYSKNGSSTNEDGYFVRSVKNGLNHTSSMTTDPKIGQVLTQTDINGLTSVNTYDAFGRVESVNAPGVPIANTRYRKCSLCPTYTQYKVTTVQSGSPDSTLYKDMFSRDVLVASRAFGSRTHNYVKSTYNRLGQAIFESAPYSSSIGNSWVGTRYNSYDALGRLTQKSVDQAAGWPFVTDYVHDGFKTNISATSDKVINGSRVPTTLSLHRIYNGLEQLMETKDAINGFTRYAYDGSGNPIAMQDANGNTITAGFNAFGHKAYVIDPNMGRKDFTYNALGEVLTEKDANNQTLSFTYDVLGRMTQRKVGNVINGQWGYDNPASNKGLGLLDFEDSQVQSDGSRLTKTFEYSATSTGRKAPTKVTHRIYSNNTAFTDYAVNTAYDPVYGRVSSLTYPNGFNLGFEYNQHGYLTREKDIAANTVFRQITAMDARNLATNSRLANGLLSETVNYAQQTGQMRGIQVKKGGELRHSLDYLYDGFGNLHFKETKHGDDRAEESFDYDNLHRVTRSTRQHISAFGIGLNLNDVINYAFDKVGNLTLKSDYASGYTYSAGKPNAVSQITLASGGTVNFGYDNNGNMTTGHGKTMSYNVFNKPSQIIAGGSTSHFEYGADTMRYKKTETGTNNKTTHYIGKLMEVVTEGTTVKQKAYIGGTAIVTDTSVNGGTSTRQTHYLLKGRLGSTVTVTDSVGEIVETNGFDAFGKPRTGFWKNKASATLDSQVTTRGYTGHEHLDESQLIHMNGRAYDYNLGRFLSVDPYIQEPGNSQSMNPYSYLMNNPLSGTDPTGFKGEVEQKTVNVSIGKHSKITRKVNVTSQANATGGQNVSLTGGGNDSQKAVTAVLGLNPNGASNSNGASSLGANATGGNDSVTNVESSQGNSFEGSNVNVNSYGVEPTVETYRPMSSKEKDEYYDAAIAKLRLQIVKSKAFSSEQLRDQYLKLLNITSFDYKDIEIGTPALADYENSLITLYKSAMIIQTRRDREAPVSLTVKRMAKILSHELRHLTNVNHAIPSSVKSLISEELHDADPREQDANTFESNLWGRAPNTIQDF